VDAYPNVPAWRAALGRLLWDSGDVEQAQRELDVLAAHGFEDIPRDGNWMIAMTLLAELTAGLGDARRAARLYELLLPFEGVNVVIGLAAVCYGSAARYLGQLAACLGHRDRAVAHFERALAANDALRAPVWLAHTQLDCASALGAGAAASELLAAAARTAEELDLPALARRASELQAR
jgi:tetratricopeptide (TPR) repeat protein